ncbi:secretion system X translation initiation factor [Ralstonia solanacearum]|uniref:secretion system X translation initiation factor n=1 Tax=Ralstonia solanacearum TaxID=305 RepID=UPI0018D0584C|nr:secretion system X translation initiation factor [Ralstonia solanacearum]
MKATLVTRSLLGAAAIATAALSYWVAAKRPDAPATAPVSGASAGHRPDRPAQRQAWQADPPAAPEASAGPDGVGAHESLAALRPPLSAESANDPFTVLSWLPPPPPPPPVVAPAPVPEPPPSAPALPFVYLGTLNPDAAKPQVFISNGDRLLIVSPGEVIDGMYRFESIAATGALFTYLPLNQQQVMPVQGEGN